MKIRSPALDKLAAWAPINELARCTWRDADRCLSRYTHRLYQKVALLM